MNQAVTISEKTIDNILARLDALTKDVKAIKTNLLKNKPSYGSNEWWEKEIEEGLEEVKRGKVHGPFKKTNELLKALHQDAGF